MTFMGFKRAKIKVAGEDEIITIEGNAREGATVNAEITGVSKEPVRVWGSDIPYFVVQTGAGEIAVNVGIIDALEAASDKILGYKTNEKKFTFIGGSTNPPDCSLLLETADLDGTSAFIGFPKGKFSKDAINLNTKTGQNNEPEADAYGFTPSASDRDDETKEETMMKYIGTEHAEEFEKLVFGIKTTP
ncbi:major tail protein [Enterococcus sp. BWR-S5]|uniref:major tail protein n=1 Tax=Enterococcus sp. BWR-S5 TaxID=2787714 RepID=UPI001924578A|nr:major tail protein [Enterococcus sp. BWR-S5]MBL1224790.1 phage tail protein [Enterococcus sp. BWR-S5]